MSKVDHAVNFVAMAPTMTKDTAAATDTTPALIDSQQQVKMLSCDEQAWSKLWSSSSTTPAPASVVQQQQQHDSLRSPAGLYHCHICSFTGQTEGEFKQHMLSHYNHACPQCDYASRTEGRLRRHIREFHTPLTSKRGSGQPKLFRCRQCQFVASDKVVFWEHSASHIKAGRMQRCPHCPFVTEYKHHLEYHLRNHAGSKPFQCTKCNYSCVNKSMLNSHMKSHTNVYQYRCADCTFATKYCHSLRLHLDKTTHRAAAVLNPDGSLPAADVKDTFNDVIKRGDRSGARSSRTRRQRCLTPDRSRSPKSETSAQQSYNASSISPFISQNASSRTASCSFPEAPVSILPPLLPMANLFLPHPHPQSILSPYSDPRPPAGLCKNESPDDVTPHSPKIDSGDGRGAWSEYVKSMVKSFQASVGSSIYGSDLSLYHQGHHMSLSPHLSPYYGVQRVQQQVSLASSSSSANNTASWLLDSMINVSGPEDPLFKPSSTAASAEANAVASAVADEDTDTVQNTDEAADEVPLDLSIQSRCFPSSPQGHSKDDSEVTSQHPPSSEASPVNSNLNSIVSDIVCKSEVTVDNISVDVATLPRKNRRKGTARKVDVTVVNGDQVYTETGGKFSCWLGDSAVNRQPSNTNTDLDPTTESTTMSGLTNDLENISPVSEGNSNTCRQFGSAESQDGGWLYECQHCLLSFRDYVMYILHKGYHGYTDPFRCNLCGQTSANRVDFFVHIAQVAHE